MNLWDKIKKFLLAIDTWNKEELTEMHERELMELQHIFALVNFGVVVGLPMPPLHITAELLPFLDKEIEIMFNRLENSFDPLGELFSILSID